MTADPTGGWFTYKELLARGTIHNRMDLARKQKVWGFPLTVKLSDRQAAYPKQAVFEWELARIKSSDATEAAKRKAAAEMQAAE